MLVNRFAFLFLFFIFILSFGDLMAGYAGNTVDLLSFWKHFYLRFAEFRAGFWFKAKNHDLAY